MTISLRRRLLLILLGLILISWLISVVITALFAQQTLLKQIDQQLTYNLEMSRYTLGSIYEDPILSEYYQSKSVPIRTEPGVARVNGFGSQGRELATNLWFKRSQIVVGREAPIFPKRLKEGIVHTELNSNGETSAWRILYRYDRTLNIWIASGLNMSSVSSMGRAAMWRSVFPLLVILPLTILILFWGISRGLRPLDQLATKIAARKPSALDPINQEGVPLEIQPVVTSLNGLLDRLQQALVSERRFTSNAAHELQTPLAAIKAEVQRSWRQTKDIESRQMLERIEVRVTRAADTVTQMLTLARLDPEQQFGHEKIDLNRVVIDLIAEEGHVAADRHLEIEIEEDPDVTIEGHQEWIKILIRNLLSNAFKYAVASGVVYISLKREADSISLSVANACEAITESQRQRLTDRFYSLPGREAGGVGLGLSIVKRIADLHGATLSLDSQGGERGFLVKVYFAKTFNNRG